MWKSDGATGFCFAPNVLTRPLQWRIAAGWATPTYDTRARGRIPACNSAGPVRLLLPARRLRNLRSGRMALRRSRPRDADRRLHNAPRQQPALLRKAAPDLLAVRRLDDRVRPQRVHRPVAK